MICTKACTTRATVVIVNDATKAELGIKNHPGSAKVQVKCRLYKMTKCDLADKSQPPKLELGEVNSLGEEEFGSQGKGKPGDKTEISEKTCVVNKQVECLSMRVYSRTGGGTSKIIHQCPAYMCESVAITA